MAETADTGGKETPPGAGDGGPDIVALKREAREARERAAFLESILEHVSDAVFATDEKGNFIFANKLAREDFQGVVPEEDSSSWLGMSNLFHVDKVTPLNSGERPLRRAMQGETVENEEYFEVNKKTPEGAFFNVSCKPLPLGPEGRVGAVATYRNVSGRKQTEARLARTLDELSDRTELMETMFEGISEGIVVATGEGEFLYVNSAAEDLVGMGPTEKSPEEWSEHYGTFYADRETPVESEDLPLVRAAVGGETIDDEDLFIRNPNRPRGVNIRVSARPLRDQDGEIRAGLVILRDVTQEMIAEQALVDAFAHGRLEILDTVLHNIGNAINSVAVGMESLHSQISESVLVRRLGNVADIIAKRGDDRIDWLRDDPRGRLVLPFIVALAEDFRRENKRIARTLDRVRDRAKHVEEIVLAQKTLGSTVGRRKVVVLRKVIAGAVNILSGSLDKRGIRVEIDCGDAPREIRVQENRLHEALVNLIKNAIEAIDMLSAAGELDGGPSIRVAAHADGEFLHLDVTDNGIGIDQKHIKAIFNAGYTTKKGGSGLGLHSTANFVIGTGGKVRALSEGKRQGTTMRLMLRLSSILPPPPPATRRRP